MPCDDGLRCRVLKEVFNEDVDQGKRLQSITETMCRILKVPTCLIMLLNEEQGKVISCEGWPHGSASRPMSFCAWSLIPVVPEVLVVGDARKDARFRQNPLVTSDPHITFYAGAPLLHGQHRLGSLCIIDDKPRQFDAEGCALLSNFADLCMEDIRDGNTAVLMCDISSRVWTYEYANETAQKLTQRDTVGFWDDFQLPGSSSESLPSELMINLSENRQFKIQVTKKQHEDKQQNYLVTCRPAWKSSGKRRIPFLTAISEVGQKIHSLYLLTIVSAEGPRKTLHTDDAFVSKEVTQPPPFEDLEVHQVLGKGSFGVVHKGLWSGRDVAIKIMPFRQNFDPSAEAELVANVRHPNVVETFAFCMDSKDTGWLIMELCLGGGLLQAIDKGDFRTSCSFYEGTADLQKVYDVAEQIATGMQYLHEQQVIHSDLNCNNVLMSERKLKIADFGMAQLLTEAVLETDSLGTVTHMPPELLEDGILSKATDVYSFGVILWELVTSRRAWGGVRPGAIVAHKISGKSRLEFPQEVPADLRQLGKSCMSDDQDERPTFQEIIDKLRNLRESGENARDFPVYT